MTLQEILCAGCGFGLGWVVCHFVVVRGLVDRLARMRYAGFMGDPPPMQSERFRAPPRPREE